MDVRERARERDHDRSRVGDRQRRELREVVTVAVLHDEVAVTALVDEPLDHARNVRAGDARQRRDLVLEPVLAHARQVRDRDLRAGAQIDGAIDQLRRAVAEPAHHAIATRELVGKLVRHDVHRP
jgi:hypothetical protein